MSALLHDASTGAGARGPQAQLRSAARRKAPHGLRRGWCLHPSEARSVRPS